MQQKTVKRSILASAVSLLLSASACSSVDGEPTASGPQTTAGAVAPMPPETPRGAAAGADGAMSSSTAPSMPSAEVAPDDGSATWTSIYDHVFRSCKNSDCHGKGLAGVDMATKEGALTSLLNMPANPNGQCAALGKLRIVPGDPMNSLLYLKLDVLGSPCGQQMPPGGELPVAMRNRVRDWIMNGAKND